MKTTIEINDELLLQLKQVAAKENVTLREIFESGIRGELQRRAVVNYALPDRSFTGNGLQPGIKEGDWDQISELIYSGYGG